MKQIKWKTEKRKVKDLVPFPDNPRTLSEEQRKQLERSINKFDLAEIPCINTDNMIIAGHQRMHILMALDRGEEMVDVRVPNRKLTESEVREYNIRSNKNTASWDGSILQNSFSVEDLLSWGFNREEFTDLDIFSPAQNELLEVEVSLDRADELQKKWKTKLGQLWGIGKHRLLCGDSTHEEELNRLLLGRKVDMVFTDPPYNVRYGESKKPNHKIREIKNDWQSVKEWESFVKKIASILKQWCSGDCYIWGASSADGMRMRLWIIEAGLHWSATIIWKKNRLILSPAKYQRLYEPCLYGWFNKSSFRANRKQVEVWEIDRPSSSPEHPTMKPVKLAEMAIQNSSNEKDIVMDLFIGAGSTMIAAEQLKRICFGMEIEPKYVAVTLERMNLLGIKGELIKE